jgi:hypothetical protein
MMRRRAGVIGQGCVSTLIQVGNILLPSKVAPQILCLSLITDIRNWTDFFYAGNIIEVIFARALPEV